MPDKTVNYNGATVALKRATVRSRLHSGIIYRKFNVGEDTPDEEFSMLFNYVKFLTQTDIQGEIGFKVPTYADEPKDLEAGYQTFLDQPETFFDEVVIPLTRIDAGLAEDELQPTIDQKKA